MKPVLYGMQAVVADDGYAWRLWGGDNLKQAKGHCQ
jgi:hypothetical protein